MATPLRYNFTGTTKECFVDFAVSRFDDFDDQKIIAQVLGVSYESTFRPWVRNGLVARGERLIRIRVIMELFGYHVSEWQDLQPSLRAIADAIAFDVRTPQQVFEDLGYRNINDLYRVILSDQSSMLPDRQEMAVWYAQEIREEVETRRNEVINLIKSRSSKLARALANQNILSNPAVETTKVTSGLSKVDVETLAEVFGGLVSAMLPIAKLLVGDTLSLDERRAIRNTVGRGNIAQLNGLVDALTSEQNRDIYLTKQGKERIGR